MILSYARDAARYDTRAHVSHRTVTQSGMGGLEGFSPPNGNRTLPVQVHTKACGV